MSDFEKQIKQGLGLLIFGAVVITTLLALQLFATFSHNNKPAQPTVIIQDVANVNLSNSASDCQVQVCRSSKHGGKCEFVNTGGEPFAIMPDMEDAYIYVPKGTSIDFTTDNLNAKTVELKAYDDTAFDYSKLANGFRLTVKTNIPEGVARTTDVRVNGNLFYVQFAFTKPCE